MTTEKKISGKAVTRAGETLIVEGISTDKPEEYEQAMNILSYWRSCHEKPLEEAYALLNHSVDKIERKAVTAKRLKRTPSIVLKLKRFETMKLRSMQDIGGCRAIVSSEKKLVQLVRELKKKKKFRIKDYIKNPKDDGYRGVHLIGDFSNGHGSKKSIEIQVRTKSQHSWATAVEIIDLFTNQALKSNHGEDEWKKFFKYVGKQFSYIERLPLYHMRTQDELTKMLYHTLQKGYSTWDIKKIRETCESSYILSNKLGVLEKFNAFSGSLKVADEHINKMPIKGYILLDINVNKPSVKSTLFPSEKFEEAASKYLTAEKKANSKSNHVVALVSTDAVGGIKEAYPNYFADSTRFMHNLNITINAYRLYNPTRLSRSFKKIFGGIKVI